jgi:large subunit ribosomal protein L22
MVFKYAYQGDTQNIAKAIGLNLDISTKVSYEIGNFIVKKKVSVAKKLLADVVSLKQAVPYKRYNREVAHKTGNLAGGRYPSKASKAILRVLNNALANALDLGLDEDKLVIVHFSAHNGPKRMRYGRHRGREAKSTHIQIVLKEMEIKETKKKTPKKEISKVKETKKAEKKETAKTTEKKEKKVETKKTKDENKKEEVNNKKSTPSKNKE